MNSITMSERALPYFIANPIQALHRLREAGFTEKQAEVQIEIAAECYKSSEEAAATKENLDKLEIDLRKDLKEMELRLDYRFKEIDLKFKELEMRLKELEMRLTIKTGAITSAVVGFFYILEKFF